MRPGIVQGHVPIRFHQQKPEEPNITDITCSDRCSIVGFFRKFELILHNMDVSEEVGAKS